MRNTLLYILLIAKSLSLNAQDSLRYQTVIKHYEAYNRNDYKTMHDCYSGLMKLVFTQGKLKDLNETFHLVKGSVQIKQIKPISSSALSVSLMYSRDTTEIETVSYSFNKKGKIAGLRMKGESFKAVKSTGKPLPANFSKRMDSLVQLKFQAANFSGCVAVIDHGNLVYKSCKGETVRGSNHLINDSTLFELASLSKQFTAIAILMLKERGKLTLEDPITKWLPNLPYNTVTIHQLLSHTGGLPDYGELMDSKWNKNRIATNVDVIDFFANNKPKPIFKPGKKFEYSNTGYVFLASIIEKASGMSFDSFMKHEIFEKLGMSRTRIYHTRRSGESLENYALGYVYNDSLKGYIIPDSLSEYNYVKWLDGITGDGCVNSTILDLAKWEQGLREETLVQSSTLKLAFTSNIVGNENTNYGYGWEVQADSTAEAVVYHTGSWPGYINLLVHYTTQPRSIIILSSSEYFYIMRFANKIGRMMQE